MYKKKRSNYLAHHGIMGQKWGVRRFQNEDGSLTEAGKARYGYGSESKNSDYSDPKQLKRATQGYKKAVKEWGPSASNSAYLLMNSRANEFAQSFNDKYKKTHDVVDPHSEEYINEAYAAYNKVHNALMSAVLLKRLGDAPNANNEAVKKEIDGILKEYGQVEIAW